MYSVPYDVEFGYNPIWDKELEISRRIDDKVATKEKQFLIRVQELFDEFGVEDFHQYNDFDFEMCLNQLKNKEREKLETLRL